MPRFIPNQESIYLSYDDILPLPSLYINQDGRQVKQLYSRFGCDPEGSVQIKELKVPLSWSDISLYFENAGRFKYRHVGIVSSTPLSATVGDVKFFFPN